MAGGDLFDDLPPPTAPESPPIQQSPAPAPPPPPARPLKSALKRPKPPPEDSHTPPQGMLNFHPYSSFGHLIIVFTLIFFQLIKCYLASRCIMQSIKYH